MFEKAIGLKLGFNYQIKFFLILWLGEYKDGFSRAETIKDFSLKFGVPLKWVSVALNELLGRGYFVSQNEFNANNRIYTKYAISKKLEDRLVGQGCNHMAFLKLLLFKRSESNNSPLKKGRKKFHSHFNITDDSRLLLAVLIHMSDDCGVVTKCGVAELNKLTGMSKDKIRSHIEVLIKERYINRAISGLTGKYILGVKQGVYFLNLKHQAFLGDKCQGIVFDLGDGHKKTLEAYNLFKTKERLLTLLSFGVDMQQRHLDSVFFQDASDGLAGYFQSLINHYAALILISYPKSLGEKLGLRTIKGEWSKELADIELELIPESVKRNIENLTPAMARLLAEATLYSSIELAGAVRDELVAGKKADLLRGRFIINKYANKGCLGGGMVKSSDIIFNIEFFT
jgi:hypothetical protein